MNTLHLTLKRRWFDMELSGEKPEEYRDIKPYWIRRLVADGSYSFEKLGSEVIRWSLDETVEYNQFTHIQFTNGYSKKSPSFTIECNGIRIGRGNPEWGAPTDTDVFILSLGKITANEKANTNNRCL